MHHRYSLAHTQCVYDAHIYKIKQFKKIPLTIAVISLIYCALVSADVMRHDDMWRRQIRPDEIYIDAQLDEDDVRLRRIHLKMKIIFVVGAVMQSAPMHPPAPHTQTHCSSYDAMRRALGNSHQIISIEICISLRFSYREPTVERAWFGSVVLKNISKIWLIFFLCSEWASEFSSICVAISKSCKFHWNRLHRSPNTFVGVSVSNTFSFSVSIPVDGRVIGIRFFLLLFRVELHTPRAWECDRIRLDRLRICNYHWSRCLSSFLTLFLRRNVVGNHPKWKVCHRQLNWTHLRAHITPSNWNRLHRNRCINIQICDSVRSETPLAQDSFQMILFLHEFLMLAQRTSVRWAK